MPRVKIDYIVSFSSEDPENQANNLLAWEVNKKKWLCSKGESSCSVVLQLAQAVEICTVQVGSFHSAMVEVLVGRSETPNEPFEVLVPRSVVLSPRESRAGAAARVRSFGAEALAAAARRRWDRVRLVCSQPYDRHSKYGLSFVHIYTPEAPDAPPTVLSTTPHAAATFSSDSDSEFQPGELFAQHRRTAAIAPTDTGAQIRQATSQALKNIPDSSIKLTKTTIPKTDRPRSARPGDDRSPSRRWKDRDNRKRKNETPDRDPRRPGGERRGDAASERDEKTTRRARDRFPETNDGGGDSGEGDRRGRRRPSADGPRRAGPRCAAPHTLLRGVVCVLSGYENPRRAALRAAALALGASCERDWGPRCTHLICAFPNTPKLRAVRAGPAGARAVAVRGEWLEDTARRRRRLPWQWYATEPARREPPPATDSDGGDASPAECDTDEEIERVRRQIKKRRSRSPSPGPSAATTRRPPSATATNSDAKFNKNERSQDTRTAEDSDGSDTEPESDAGAAREELAPRVGLPDLFRGCTFALAPALRAAPLLARYVRAYGGLLHEAGGTDGGADYVLCEEAEAAAGAGAAGGVRVHAAWVWRCHAARRLCDVTAYRLG